MTANKIFADRYQCLRLVGEGGMASVYLAMDIKLNREVAIKVMHDHMREKSELRSRFRKEAHAVSKLRHSNILEIYDYSGNDSDELWIVTEFIDGLDLSKFVKKFKDKKLNPFIATCIVRELAKALVDAHRQGIIHRDIKPSNIMISKTGHVKLMDFGIAKDMALTDFTHVGTFMGSPSYMSPEQINGSGVDVRTDLYALCVLFYEIVTAELPFTGSNTHEIINKVLHRDAPSPKELDLNIPRFISDFIQKGLKKEINKRHHAALDVVKILDDYLREHGLGDSRVELESIFENPKRYQRKLESLGLTKTLYDSKDFKTISKTIISDLDKTTPDSSLIKKVERVSRRNDEITPIKKIESSGSPENANKLKISEKHLLVLNKTNENEKNKESTDNKKPKVKIQKLKQSIDKKSKGSKQHSRKIKANITGNRNTSKRARINSKKHQRPKTRVMTANVTNRGGFLQDVTSFAVSFLISGIVIALVAISYGVLVKNIPLDEFLNRTFSANVSLKSIFAPLDNEQDDNDDTKPQKTIELKYEIKNEIKDNSTRKLEPQKNSIKDQKKINKSHIKNKKSITKRRKAIKVPSYKYVDEPIELEVNRYSNESDESKLETSVPNTRTMKTKRTISKKTDKEDVSNNLFISKKRTQNAKKEKLEPKYIVNAEVTPNARVYINKSYIGRSKNTLEKGYPLKKGRYQITFSASGYKNYKKIVYLKGKEEVIDLGQVKLEKKTVNKLSIETPIGANIEILKANKVIIFIEADKNISNVELDNGSYRIKVEYKNRTLERTISFPSIYGDTTVIFERETFK